KIRNPARVPIAVDVNVLAVPGPQNSVGGHAVDPAGSVNARGTAKPNRADQAAGCVEHGEQVVFVVVDDRAHVRVRIDRPQVCVEAPFEESFGSTADNEKLHPPGFRADRLLPAGGDTDQLSEVVLVVDPDVTALGVVAADDLEIDRALAARFG